MRVALLADAHANLPAVEAVLDDARRRGAEAVWNLGDLVGYGPFPDQTVQLLGRRADASIRGNYDRKVINFRQKKQKWQRTKLPQKYLAIRWAYEALSPASRAYLQSLPEQLRLEAGGARVLLVHGSPASDHEAITPATPPMRLEQLGEQAEADLVACGHTHEACDLTAGGTRFVNPGAVGRPEGSDPRAAYAMLTLSDGRIEAELLRVEYDVDRAVSALRGLGLPRHFGEMIRRGENLDRVRAAPEPDPPAPNVGTGDDAPLLEAVQRLAREYHYEAGHTHQVTRLSLELFDQLAEVHGYGPRERNLLQSGAMLHDVGTAEGPQGHHKTAMRIVLASDLPADQRRKRIIALLARYHRKALPRRNHLVFRDLSEEDQRRVWLLGGLLRLADALDRSHLSLVRAVECRADAYRIVVRCRTRAPLTPEVAAAGKKKSMLARATERAIEIEVRQM